jgi:glycolate oxidase iron-sulfur subunit
MDKFLEDMRTATLECTFCGSCQASCPVFAEIGADAACSRGRLFQLRCLADGKLKENPKLAESISRCTLCMACKASCPAGIRTTELFLRFRKRVGERVSVPAVKRAAFTSLTYRALFEFCLRFGALSQSVFFKKHESGKGYEARFPIPLAGLNKRRIIPRPAKTPLRGLVPERSVPAGKIRAKAAFFPGCMLNYIYPAAGRALVDALLANGVEVLLPPGLSCCGTPVFTSGDFATAAVLARRNVRILAGLDVDAVITGCATCGTALSHEYGLVLEDDPALPAWKEIGAKVSDFAAFLVDLGYSDRFRPVRRKVTYHDPCHLVRGMGVADAPRRLIRAVPGIEFVEMRDAGRCCGCAGSFSASHYELSRAINDDKIRNAGATGADLLVTGCSACRMHILDGLGRNAVPMEVLHTAELLALAYEAPHPQHA